MKDIELRCTCRRKPLLAIIKDGEGGAYYLHVKSVRSGQPVVSIVIEDGKARVYCRECGRWTTVKISPNNYETQQESLPRSIEA